MIGASKKIRMKSNKRVKTELFITEPKHKVHIVKVWILFFEGLISFFSLFGMMIKN